MQNDRFGSDYGHNHGLLTVPAGHVLRQFLTMRWQLGKKADLSAGSAVLLMPLLLQLFNVAFMRLFAQRFVCRSTFARSMTDVNMDRECPATRPHPSYPLSCVPPILVRFRFPCLCCCCCNTSQRPIFAALVVMANTHDAYVKAAADQDQTCRTIVGIVRYIAPIYVCTYIYVCATPTHIYIQTCICIYMYM